MMQLTVALEGPRTCHSLLQLQCMLMRRCRLTAELVRIASVLMLIVHMQSENLLSLLGETARTKFNMAFVKFEIIIIRMPTILNSI